MAPKQIRETTAVKVYREVSVVLVCLSIYCSKSSVTVSHSHSTFTLSVEASYDINLNLRAKSPCLACIEFNKGLDSGFLIIHEVCWPGNCLLHLYSLLH